MWWFAECLTVVQAEAHFTQLVDMLDTDDEFRRFCGVFLSNVGTGIDELSIEKARIDADKVPRQLLEQLQPPKGRNVAFTIGGPGVALELDAADPTKVVRKNLAARHQV